MKNMKSIGATMRMRILKNDMMEMLQFPALADCCNISHFITTRIGGVSQGNFASMNPSVYTEDDKEAVEENMRRLSCSIQLPADRIIAPHQVHKDNVGVLDETFLQMSESDCRAFLEGLDALVTQIPGLCVAVATADCVPVLLYAPDKQVVAAVHAGWRGTVQRIVQKSVQIMKEVYDCDPALMMAGIGPSISRSAFEVGDEVVLAFSEAGFPMDTICCRNSETGKAHIDLWEANRFLLLESGLIDSHVETANICTYFNYEYLFSARRLGVQSGRILSGIFICDDKEQLS